MDVLGGAWYVPVIAAFWVGLWLRRTAKEYRRADHDIRVAIAVAKHCAAFPSESITSTPKVPEYPSLYPDCDVSVTAWRRTFQRGAE
jgi:hypothetical protein